MKKRFVIGSCFGLLFAFCPTISLADRVSAEPKQVVEIEYIKKPYDDAQNKVIEELYPCNGYIVQFRDGTLKEIYYFNNYSKPKQGDVFYIGRILGYNWGKITEKVK